METQEVEEYMRAIVIQLQQGVVMEKLSNGASKIKTPGVRELSVPIVDVEMPRAYASRYFQTLTAILSRLDVFYIARNGQCYPEDETSNQDQ